MDNEEKITLFLQEQNSSAEILHFENSCHSVAEAAIAVKGTPEDFIKSICCITDSGELVVLIVKGEDRADIKKAGEILHTKLSFATADQVLVKTGYPPGGVPPFGYTAHFFIDERVMEKNIVYGGGGSDHALVKVMPDEILRLTDGNVGDVRK